MILEQKRSSVASNVRNCEDYIFKMCKTFEKTVEKKKADYITLKDQEELDGSKEGKALSPVPEFYEIRK